ncbi:MAG TPA: hypothetical protein ENH82_10960 [bacterium]|nr:hypothetical protein [bacterium]
MTCRTAINQAELQTPLPKRFILHGVTQLAACINWFKNYRGKTVDVNITEYIPDHTDSQQGYFHVLCGIYGKEVGETPGDIKLAVKKKLWGTEIHIVGNIEIEVFKSMAKGKSNKLDYIDAIETILQMAAEDGIYLPEPQ